MSLLITHSFCGRSLLAASFLAVSILTVIVLPLARAAAEDDLKSINEVFRSRAESFNAEAQNKQANAAIINAMANYGKASAEAGKVNQETRGMSAQNDLLETRVYYEKRGLYHTYQDAHKPTRATPDKYAEWARKAAPGRLADNQLWIKPGYLRWPTLLRHADFAEPRTNIDALMADRSQDDSGAGSENCVAIQSHVDRLKTTLASQVKRYKTNDYLTARRFLDGVALEAQEPSAGLSPPIRSYSSVIGN